MKEESGMFEKSKKYLKNTVLATIATAGIVAHELPAQKTGENHNNTKPVENVQESKVSQEVHKFKVFKQYELGSKSISELKQEVDGMTLYGDEPIHIEEAMLNKIHVSHERKQLNLVKIRVADLGFKQGATYAQLLSRAQELGLQLCPAEVGPGLRSEYLDQPDQDIFYIAMEPITVEGELDSKGRATPFIFRIECEKVDPKNHPSGLYLQANTVGEYGTGGPDWVFQPNEQFVFVEK